MKLQEKLERMTMTAFERRLLKQWLAANETADEAEPDEGGEGVFHGGRASGDATHASRVNHSERVADKEPPCTGTDGA